MFFAILMFYILLMAIYIVVYVEIRVSITPFVNIILGVVIGLVLLYSAYKTILYRTYLVPFQRTKLTNKTSDEIYHTLEHGDVVFLKDYPIDDNDYCCYLFYVYYNYGIYHTGLVVEENGTKYLIHSFARKKRPESRVKVLQSYKNKVVFDIFSNWQWHVVKEPLIEYLLMNQSMFNAYRPRVKPGPIQWKRQSNPTFCSHVVATLLKDNGIIPPSDKWLKPYFTTDELISVLEQRGYQSFLFKQI